MNQIIKNIIEQFCAAGYLAKNIEDKWYKFWQKHQLLEYKDQDGNIIQHKYQSWQNHNNIDQVNNTGYCIQMPPPNITGTLHLGHAFQYSIMDALIRYHRMLGVDVLFQPGVDHAGIATQIVVTRNLEAKYGPDYVASLSREDLLQEIWQWKAHSGNVIIEQMKKLGLSCDWSRLVFTMDGSICNNQNQTDKQDKDNTKEINNICTKPRIDMMELVRKIFIKLYNANYIYQAKKLVNWDSTLQTAVSDLEVRNEEVDGKMYYIKYPLLKLEDFNADLSIEDSLKYNDVKYIDGKNCSTNRNSDHIDLKILKQYRFFTTQQAIGTEITTLYRRETEASGQSLRDIFERFSDECELSNEACPSHAINHQHNSRFSDKINDKIHLNINKDQPSSIDLFVKLINYNNSIFQQYCEKYKNTPEDEHPHNANRYVFEDGIVIATTRPDTMFGDIAIAVNPNGPYRELIGCCVKHPLIDNITRLIPIIADEIVDHNFGTGFVKVTPGHDFNDEKIFENNKHKLVEQNFIAQGMSVTLNNNDSNSSRFILEKLKISSFAKNGSIKYLYPFDLTIDSDKSSHEIIRIKEHECIRTKSEAEQHSPSRQLEYEIIENTTYDPLMLSALINLADRYYLDNVFDQTAYKEDMQEKIRATIHAIEAFLGKYNQLEISNAINHQSYSYDNIIYTCNQIIQQNFSDENQDSIEIKNKIRLMYAKKIHFRLHDALIIDRILRSYSYNKMLDKFDLLAQDKYRNMQEECSLDQLEDNNNKGNANLYQHHNANLCQQLENFERTKSIEEAEGIKAINNIKHDEIIEDICGHLDKIYHHLLFCNRNIKTQNNADRSKKHLNITIEQAAITQRINTLKQLVRALDCSDIFHKTFSITAGLTNRHNHQSINHTINTLVNSFENPAIKAIVEFLKHKKLVVKEVKHKMIVPCSERTNVVIEPMYTDQWFMKMDLLAKDALELTASNTIELIPENWINTYRHWLENIQDWCISRQLVWGHRIPAYYYYDAKYTEEQYTSVSYNIDDAIENFRNQIYKCIERKKHKKYNTSHIIHELHDKKIYTININEIEVNKAQIIQDESVLDTWFSASMWCFATLGWVNHHQHHRIDGNDQSNSQKFMQNNEVKKFLPSAVLVTGFDILFFWVARMVMMTRLVTSSFFAHQDKNEDLDKNISEISKLDCKQPNGEIPFRHVYVTGLIRDTYGIKMSKSKGNVIDPVDIIDGISLDALIAKRTTGLMNPMQAPEIEKKTKKDYPKGFASFGADALRFTVANLANNNREIKFDINRVDGNRNFCNKIWNASKLVLMQIDKVIDYDNNNPSSNLTDQWITQYKHYNKQSNGSAQTIVAIKNFEQSNSSNLELIKSEQLDKQLDKRLDNFASLYIIDKFNHLLEFIKINFATYRIDLISAEIYNFFWYEYCDWYLEIVKINLQELHIQEIQNNQKQLIVNHVATMTFILDGFLKVLHPFMPFITEEIWQVLQAVVDQAANQPSTIDDKQTIDQNSNKHINNINSIMFTKYPNKITLEHTEYVDYTDCNQHPHHNNHQCNKHNLNQSIEKIDFLKLIVGKIRNIRAEIKLAPNEIINARIIVGSNTDSMLNPMDKTQNKEDNHHLNVNKQTSMLHQLEKYISTFCKIKFINSDDLYKNIHTNDLHDKTQSYTYSNAHSNLHNSSKNHDASCKTEINRDDVQDHLSIKPQDHKPAISYINVIISNYLQVVLLIEIDQNAENERIKKELEKIAKQIEHLEYKLNNNEFLQKAPSNIIEQNKQSLIELYDIKKQLMTQK